VALETLKKAEINLRMAKALGSSATASPNKAKWIERIGEYAFFCEVLGDFNPVKTREISENSDHLQVAVSYVTKIAYHSVEAN
jgi:ribosomal protein S16